MRLIAIAGLLTLAACAEPAPSAPPAAQPPATAGQAASAKASPAPADTAGADAAPTDLAPALATLRGRVAYPSEELPAMRVCALAAADPGHAHCTGTAVNQPHFELVLPVGEWWLLAWPLDTGTAGDPGLLSAASECLGSGGTGCDDHALRVVRTQGGEVREGLDINDWYYDPAAFPPPGAPVVD